LIETKDFPFLSLENKKVKFGSVEFYCHGCKTSTETELYDTAINKCVGNFENVAKMLAL
jgi:hypothetical protein